MKITTIVFCVCLVACSDGKKKDLGTKNIDFRKEVKLDSVISLKLHVKKGEQFFLGYTDEVYNFNMIETPEKLKVDTTIIKEIISRKPVFLGDIGFQRGGTFYILPGESYDVTLDSNLSKFVMKDNPKRTYEVNALRELTYSIKKQKRISEFDIENLQAIVKFLAMDFKSRDSLLLKNYEQDQQFLSEYASKNNFSVSLKNKLQKHLLFQHLTTFFQFNKRSEKQVLEYIRGNKELQRKVQNEMNCDSCLDYPLYPYLTRSFAKYYVADPDRKGTEFAYTKYKDYFTGKTRDYLLYDLIKLGGMFNDTKPNPTLANRFLTDATDPVLKSYIGEMYSFLESKKAVKGTLVNLEGVDSEWSKILNKHKGKVVYVDFWASWCGPCRAEMPKSHELRKRFDTDKVSFVYISLDENSVAWKKAAAQEGINKTESYIMVQPDHSELIKKYRINAIPRYFLIDKTGRIVNSNAERPGDVKIYKEIQQLL